MSRLHFYKKQNFSFNFLEFNNENGKRSYENAKKQLSFNAYLAKSLNQEKAKLSQVNQVKPN